MEKLVVIIGGDFYCYEYESKEAFRSFLKEMCEKEISEHNRDYQIYMEWYKTKPDLTLTEKSRKIYGKWQEKQPVLPVRLHQRTISLFTNSRGNDSFSLSKFMSDAPVGKPSSYVEPEIYTLEEWFEENRVY